MPEQWEVRKPRLYGSEHLAWFATEALARAYAEDYARKHFPGHGLTIITRSKTIYIDHEDE